MYNIIYKDGKAYHRICGKELSFDEISNHWCDNCGRIQSTKNEAINYCGVNIICGASTLGECLNQMNTCAIGEGCPKTPKWYESGCPLDPEKINGWKSRAIKKND